jgi:hypothetical protein
MSMSQPSEKGFAATLKEAATLLGWKFYHVYDSRRSEPGFPDVLLAKPGRKLILAELKMEDGKLTAGQEAWLELLRLVPGIEVYLWTPKMWESIVKVLT